MKEDSVAGGTLSSGVDCWLKKVEYPIINKWYAEHVAKTGSYHKDTSEGLDDFHVGISRGCGGIAVLTDGVYFTSKNYTAYKTLSNGYMRTAFDLDFTSWEIGNGNIVTTSKRISLDRGSQMSRIEVAVRGANQISAGLTLHENDGEVTIDSLGGWISYWQPHADSFLGTVLIAAPGTFIGADKVVSDQKDLSNAYLSMAVQDGKAVYYSGFFWEKSEQFESKEEWHAYLNRFSQQMSSPLVVSRKK